MGKYYAIKKPYRSDIGGSYHKELNGAVMGCRLNVGHNKYFFVEERYYVEQEDGRWKIGSIKKIHHYNQTPEQLQIK